jgi:hypothetical protein
MDSIIEQVRCTKPKRSDNTYVCQVHVGDSKTKLQISFNNSKIIQVKHAFQPGDFTIYMKNRKMHDFLYDLNNYIIDYTRRNCSDWFGNSMNPELLEDYFSNPLVYMKNYGDVIKLKCINSPNINEFIDKTCDLSISICNIRFYKQKFMYECKVDSVLVSHPDITSIGNLSDDFDDDEDLPEPTADELDTLRQEYTQILIEKQKNLQNEMIKLEENINNVSNSLTVLDKYLDILEKENVTVEEIYKIGTEIEEL